MINLLPPALKKELLLAQKKKVGIILGITFLIPLICLALILSSLLLYLLGEANVQANILDQAKKQYQTAEFLNFKNIIQQDNKSLRVLASFYKKDVAVSFALKTLSGLTRPEGLYFTNLSLTKNNDNTLQGNVSGFSKSRDDLLVLQKNMQANTALQTPLFSPQSWVEAKNSTFYVTFLIHGQ